jgi:hypothetical protein
LAFIFVAGLKIGDQALEVEGSKPVSKGAKGGAGVKLKQKSSSGVDWNANVCQSVRRGLPSQ